MLDFARKEDTKALQELWTACFDGPPGYADFYYSRRFVPEDTLVWREEGGRPVSMMTLMRVRQGGQDGAYVYAVATLPAFRGRGLMTRLDQWAQEVIRQRGWSFSVLVPAEPALFPMYEKLGYRSCFPVWTKLVAAGGRKTVDFSSCPFEEFRELRKRFLYRIPGAVLHPEEELRYIYDELHGFSGEILRYEEKDGACYVAFTVEEDGLLIREATGSDPVGVARALLARYGSKQALVRYHKPVRGFQKSPFGMGRRLDKGKMQEGYMALMLD